jgi:hypothetical protein
VYVKHLGSNYLNSKNINMKKNLLIVILMSFTLSSFGQIKSVDFSKAIPSDSPKFIKSKIVYEQLLEQNPEYGGYVIYYESTPVGIKHCIENVRSIVFENGLSIDKPNYLDNSIIGSSVDGIKDYENLWRSINQGESEIKKGWKTSDGYLISLTLTKKGYSIYFP